MTWSHNGSDQELHVATMTPFPIISADDWCGEHSQK